MWRITDTARYPSGRDLVWTWLEAALGIEPRYRALQALA